MLRPAQPARASAVAPARSRASRVHLEPPRHAGNASTASFDQACASVAGRLGLRFEHRPARHASRQTQLKGTAAEGSFVARLLSRTALKAAALHTFVVKRSDMDATPAPALAPLLSGLPDRALRDHRRAISIGLSSSFHDSARRNVPYLSGSLCRWGRLLSWFRDGCASLLFSP